jgi:hypothetical protein
MARETAKIDALVAKVREAIDKLREYRIALISAAVTGKVDLRGEVGPLEGEGKTSGTGSRATESSSA